MMRPLAIAALLAACAAEREPTVTPPLVTWLDQVAAVVPARCGRCHGGATPAAGYDATTYENAITQATAGDPSSPMLTVLDDATHAPVADLRDLVRAWVVDSQLAYFDTPLHPPSWLDPSAKDFHGAFIVSSGYDLALCQSCHGGDYRGGTSGKSCETCHRDPGGPVACTTCHAQPPATGAHQRHVAAGLACADCHPVPATWDAPGHLPSVDVVLGAKAARDLVPSRRTGPPSYDAETKTCANVYCHGGVFGAGAGTHSSPRWDDGDPAIACGGCHGAPPADHGAGETECAICHGNAPHMDGAVQVGQACNACHGGAANAAPPRGLHGETSTSQLAVGAHQGHVTAAAGISAPIPCSACHVTPTAVDDPGHLDGDMIAEVTLPGWDRTSATCSGTYCHGPATPVWTDATGPGDACGSCHGVPPAQYHDPSLTLHDCTTCHPDIDGSGNFTIPSEHINGQVDLR